jgi:hypothetical protein
MAAPLWDARQERPTHLPAPETSIEAGADEGGFALGDGTLVEPVDPQDMPHPYVFDSPEPETPAPVDDLYAALQVTPEEREVTGARPFAEVAAEAREGWSDDAKAVHAAASQVFADEAARMAAPVVETPAVPTAAPTYPTVAPPTPTETDAFPTVLAPIPTVSEPIATQAPTFPSEELPAFRMPKPDMEDSVLVDTSVWDTPTADTPPDDDFDTVLGVKEPTRKPKRVKREKTKARSTEPLLERNVEERQPRERAAKSLQSGTWVARLTQRGARSGLIAVAVGLVLALSGLFAVPALLDPTPAGGAVQSGEQRAAAVVRELNMDVDGYCHPTVEVATGFGSFEVLALKLHELNTACPVKVGESVTVYYAPNTGTDARYVRAGEVPVDIIMWSVFGLGIAAAAWGALRLWSMWKGVRIPLVTPKPEEPATLVDGRSFEQ